jgi:HK97 gp10 family phage protein
MAIKVENLPALQRDFANITAKMQRGVLRDALRAAARPVVASAKTKVPVRSGKLQRGIQQRVSVRTGSADALIGFDRKQFYGRFIELGTSKMSARPFLRPALDESQSKIEQAFIAAIERGINRKTAALSGGDD